MATETTLNTLTINYLTQEQFDSLATKEANEIYLTPDSSITGITAGSGLSGGGTSGSITLNHSNSVTAKSTQAIYPITFDAQGHITGSGSAVTIVNTRGTATSGGTTLSVVNTGDMYTWNNKQDKLTNPVTGTGTSGYLTKWNGTNTITNGPQLGSGTTKFLREDGTWQTPAYTTNTDKLLEIGAVTSGTTYYPIVAANSTTAAIRQYDSTGLSYAGTNGTANGSNGNALLTLGNSTASTSANWKKGTIRLYGTTAYYTDLLSGAPSANRTITFPNATGTVALTSDLSSFVTSSGVTSIATTSPISGGTITSTGTISHATSGVGNAVTTAGFYKFKYDTYGHVTGVTAVAASDITGLVTIPTNTDEKVKQTNTTTSSAYEILFSYTADNTERTEGARKTNTLTYNPSTKELVNGVAKLKSATSTTANTAAYDTLTLGNNVAVSSTTAHSQGQLILYGSTAYAHTLQGAPTAARTLTLPDKAGTIALTSDIPSYTDTNTWRTIQVNDSDILTSAITTGKLNLKAGTGISLSNSSGTVTITNTSTNTDEKVATAAVTSGTTYYPIVGTDTTNSETKYYDKTGITYTGTNGTANGSNGNALLTLGNSTTSTAANWKQGTIRLYGTTAYYHDIKGYSGYPTANRTIYLPRYANTMYLTCVSTTSAVGGATTAPVYVKDTGEIAAVTSIPYSLISGTPTIPTDTNTTYTLTNALSSHKFTWTFTAGGSGSGSTTTTAELVAGTGIKLTDDTTNKKITIALDGTKDYFYWDSEDDYMVSMSNDINGDYYDRPVMKAVAANYNHFAGVKPWYSTTGASTLASGSAGTNTSTPSINARTTTEGKYYAVEIDKNGRLFVNVPWTNVNSSYLTSAVTSITTSAGMHSTKSSATGAVSFNVPTKTSHLTNDSGFITVAAHIIRW